MGLWAPLTHVPVRQWVLSLPIPLRLLRKRGLEATLTGQGKPKQLLTSGGARTTDFEAIHGKRRVNAIPRRWGGAH